MSVSLSPCCIPGQEPSFHLNKEEIELGLGIHGEAGTQRLKVFILYYIIYIYIYILARSIFGRLHTKQCKIKHVGSIR